MEEEKTGMSTGRKILISLIAVLFLFTAAAYGYGVYYFRTFSSGISRKRV